MSSQPECSQPLSRLARNLEFEDSGRWEVLKTPFAQADRRAEERPPVSSTPDIHICDGSRLQVVASSCRSFSKTACPWAPHIDRQIGSMSRRFAPRRQKSRNTKQSEEKGASTSDRANRVLSGSVLSIRYSFEVKRRISEVGSPNDLHPLLQRISIR